ncbi:hypothetical protein LCGC14_1027160 [marine sediment metagenome]|uniref:Uncharacterized protein n=1 Tax=marine sediment metagenome TaxID=412755 RepID=A0A0F9QDU2_9ZZZZ
MIKYINETLEEAIEREVKIIARSLSRAMKDMGVYKSDSEVWHIAEEDVIDRYEREVAKDVSNALKVIRRNENTIINVYDCTTYRVFAYEFNIYC